MSEYVDEYIRRSSRINRASSGEAIRAAQKFKKINKKIADLLAELSIDGFSSSTKLDVKRKIAKLLVDGFSDAATDASLLAGQLVEAEAKWQTSTFIKYTTSVVNTAPIELAVKMAATTPYQGKTFGEWFKKSGLNAVRKASAIIDSGFVEGKSIDSIHRDVKALTGKLIPELKTLVRSNLLHASSLGRQSIVSANDDIISGKVWNSTLDIRTTSNICGIRDQLKYDKNNKPVGHSVPWGAGPGRIHFNCRSLEIPIIIGVDVSVGRPSVGSGTEYSLGDNVTRIGTVRKPTKKSRDSGIFKITKKAPGTDYEKWLRAQNSDFITDALKSKDKAQAFRSGESLMSLVGDGIGAPITVSQI